MLLRSVVDPLPTGLSNLPSEDLSLSILHWGEVGGPPDVDVMDALQAVHDSMDKTVSEMRSQMTLRSEEEAMTNFRATMKNAEKFKRYIRADSESLSMLLAKVTLTTCYGIPRKARQVTSRRMRMRILLREPSSKRSGSGTRLTRLAW